MKISRKSYILEPHLNEIFNKQTETNLSEFWCDKNTLEQNKQVSYFSKDVIKISTALNSATSDFVQLWLVHHTVLTSAGGVSIFLPTYIIHNDC